VLLLFEKLLGEATTQQMLDRVTWRKWVKLLDSSLLGGSQSTFVGVAVLDGVVVGGCTGDSRAYVLARDGELRILTDGATKFRLGSGKAEALPVYHCAVQLTLE
jgi:hypothetical protein